MLAIFNQNSNFDSQSAKRLRKKDVSLQDAPLTGSSGGTTVDSKLKRFWSTRQDKQVTGKSTSEVQLLEPILLRPVSPEEGFPLTQTVRFMWPYIRTLLFQLPHQLQERGSKLAAKALRSAIAFAEEFINLPRWLFPLGVLKELVVPFLRCFCTPIPVVDL